MNLKKFFKNPLNTITSFLFRKGLFNLIPDKTFLKIRYKYKTGKKLNIKNPLTFNEKLQWLKLYNRNKEYTNLVDKYEVKKYIENKIGKDYIIPTIGIYDSFNDFDFDSLPNEFVLKCTHNSGGLIICNDKESLDIESIKKFINKKLSKNYFYTGREWPYKNIKPRIIIEQLMKDNYYDRLPVFKVFNFNGEPKLIQLILNDKTRKETVDYYDINWTKLDIRQNYPNSTIKIDKPNKLEEILTLSKELSKGFPFIRTDFYIINEKVYFSEFTFFSDCGFRNFTPDSWDLKLGEWINLPSKNK